MTELCKIAAKQGTDKLHYYTPFYDLLFRHCRLDVRKVLEIGIGFPGCMQHVPDYKTGASLRMWEEYFPQAQIFGLDINPDTLINEGRISSQECDQRKPSDLIQAAQWAGGNFDLIVDDGSHDSATQALTAILLASYLAPGGLYIIEDVSFPDQVSPLLPFEHWITFQASGTNRNGRLIVIPKEAL